MPSKEELEKKTVADLKALCKAAGLPVAGVKADLVARLVEKAPDAKQVEVQPAEATPVAKPAEATSTDKDVAADTKAAAPDPVSDDPKQKMVERAKRFNIAVPELDDQKKTDRAKRFGIVTPAVEQEKKSERAKRFGITSESDKLSSRAKRFGGGSSVGEEEDKLNARAARFGGGSGVAATAEEADKLNKRAERFGGSLTTSPATGKSNGIDVDDVKKKRAARFGLNHPELESDKKKSRLDRFGMGAASEVDKKSLRAERFKTH